MNEQILSGSISSDINNKQGRNYIGQTNYKTYNSLSPNASNKYFTKNLFRKNSNKYVIRIRHTEAAYYIRYFKKYKLFNFFFFLSNQSRSSDENSHSGIQIIQNGDEISISIDGKIEILTNRSNDRKVISMSPSSNRRPSYQSRFNNFSSYDDSYGKSMYIRSFFYQ